MDMSWEDATAETIRGELLEFLEDAPAPGFLERRRLEGVTVRLTGEEANALSDTLYRTHQRVGIWQAISGVTLICWVLYVVVTSFG